jgi:hypothetical protein
MTQLVDEAADALERRVFFDRLQERFDSLRRDPDTWAEIERERRAEAAVIAWMRHQTTGYDSMKIPRVKGQRREVRRMLAERSRELLRGYRRGEPVGVSCPIDRALSLVRARSG